MVVGGWALGLGRDWCGLDFYFLRVCGAHQLVECRIKYIGVIESSAGDSIDMVKGIHFIRRYTRPLAICSITLRITAVLAKLSS